jgi:aminoglycoside/choline kinase family phosphotransferase
VVSEEDAPVSSEEEKNKALVRRFWEAQAHADLQHFSKWVNLTEKGALSIQ